MALNDQSSDYEAMMKKLELEHKQSKLALEKNKYFLIAKMKSKRLADRILKGNVIIVDAHLVVSEWRRYRGGHEDDPDYDYIEEQLEKLVPLHGYCVFHYRARNKWIKKLLNVVETFEVSSKMFYPDDGWTETPQYRDYCYAPDALDLGPELKGELLKYANTHHSCNYTWQFGSFEDYRSEGVHWLYGWFETHHALYKCSDDSDDDDSDDDDSDDKKTIRCDFCSEDVEAETYCSNCSFETGYNSEDDDTMCKCGYISDPNGHCWNCNVDRPKYDRENKWRDDYDGYVDSDDESGTEFTKMMVNVDKFRNAAAQSPYSCGYIININGSTGNYQ